MTSHDKDADRPADEGKAGGKEDDTPQNPTSDAPVPAPPVPAPGESPGSMWPGVQAVRGEPEQQDELNEVDDTALAPPGKPDGEVDTRP